MPVAGVAATRVSKVSASGVSASGVSAVSVAGVSAAGVSKVSAAEKIRITGAQSGSKDHIMSHQSKAH